MNGLVILFEVVPGEIDLPHSDKRLVIQNSELFISFTYQKRKKESDGKHFYF